MATADVSPFEGLTKAQFRAKLEERALARRARLCALFSIPQETRRVSH